MTMFFLMLFTCIPRITGFDNFATAPDISAIMFDLYLYRYKYRFIRIFVS